MPKEAFFSDRAPNPAGPYSHAVRAGDLVFVAGQGPHDKLSATTPAGFEDQARQVFRNIAAILEAAGASMDDVVRTNVYLQDLANFQTLNSVYREFFHEPFPVRTTVQAGLNKIEIEVDVIAYAPRA